MYDKPDRRTYVFPAFTFTASETFAVRGPKGKKGRLVDYGVLGITTAFAGGTHAKVSVGIIGTLEAYGKYITITGLDNTAETLRSLYDQVADKVAFAALLVAPDLPADTNVVVNCLSASGGAEAGVGCPYAVIDWDW